MFSGLSIAFAPLLPWAVLIAAAIIGALLIGYAGYRRARGVVWRSIAIVVIWLAIANPAIVSEQREIKPDIAVVLVDDSASQSIGDRRAQTEKALDGVLKRAKALSDLEIRVVHAGGDAAAATGDGGTKLFEALDRALADIPRRRYAGAILITDGEIHDVPAADASHEYPSLAGGPLHTILTGKPGEVDRRLVIVRAPAFGLVDKPVTMTIRVEDSDAAGSASVPVTLSRDGAAPETLVVPANRDFDVTVPIDHGGQTVLDLNAAPGPHELTLVNNRAVVTVNGIRDRMRVLLISGEPHPGERTWRNLLKADPSVDLVHFTILRPPEKQDGTPINELSLIAFPIRELFEVKLNEFDLIIFDRYRRRNIVPKAYLQAIADYVQNGGAVLEAAGPTYATNLSLYYSPLGDVLPGEPTGKVFEQPFKPRLTDIGRRHPVTAGLEGAGLVGQDPSWGTWFRHVEVTPKHGQVVMSGANDAPLMILDRVGKGRVAQIASDHIWLWSRGYDGGGPQAELLRRLAHWLMHEPELEEEDLKAELRGDRLWITRRSLTAGQISVAVTDPLGNKQDVQLTEAGDGRATGNLVVSAPGLYRIEDGKRTALAAVGAINPKEFADVRATAALLQPVADATGGGIEWVGTGDGPDLRRVNEDRAAHGRDWLGLAEHREYDVTGIRQIPLLPALLVLILGVGALMLAWRREGR
jgi:uncharacterized membrane protein